MGSNNKNSVGINSFVKRQIKALERPTLFYHLKKSDIMLKSS